MYLPARRTPYDRPSRRFDQDGDRDYMKRLGLPVGGGDSYGQKDQWYRIIVSTYTLLPTCCKKSDLLDNKNTSCRMLWSPQILKMFININFDKFRFTFICDISFQSLF